jgi:hypothetical protein
MRTGESEATVFTCKVKTKATFGGDYKLRLWVGAPKAHLWVGAPKAHLWVGAPKAHL